MLGIETSCDETAAAVLEDLAILSNVVSSQPIHETYGGVVPEFASREQIKSVAQITDMALSEAGTKLDEADVIAVTCGPGLAGSLLVGLSYAKGLSAATGIPLIAVNHLEGHLFAHRLEFPEAEPPLVCLLVSGGHTQIIYIKDWGNYTVLGSTLDDAAGEAFDKVGKMLGLVFPGGPKIDGLSKDGDGDFERFPRALMGNGLDFSFSGVKTSVLYYIKRKGEQHVRRHLSDICASFQRSVVEVLIEKTIRAARESRVNRIAVGGGVSANSELRRTFARRAREEGMEVCFPAPALTTDNAAMIAAAGGYHFARGCSSASDTGIRPALRLGDEPGYIS